MVAHREERCPERAKREENPPDVAAFARNSEAAPVPDCEPTHHNRNGLENREDSLLQNLKLEHLSEDQGKQLEPHGVRVHRKRIWVHPATLAGQGVSAPDVALEGDVGVGVEDQLIHPVLILQHRVEVKVGAGHHNKGTEDHNSDEIRPSAGQQAAGPVVVHPEAPQRHFLRPGRNVLGGDVVPDGPDHVNRQEDHVIPQEFHQEIQGEGQVLELGPGGDRNIELLPGVDLEHVVGGDLGVYKMLHYCEGNEEHGTNLR
mmetsp:Transcript_13632/g.30511  ORF Transcript_13632/g.30511 Transcript_13632/m.30511 type:complete len:259 (-) Transcript_13632:165-941(-)